MASAEPVKKARRISDLRASVPFCSASALAAICQEIEKGGLPEKHKRYDIWKETKEFLEDRSMGSYGPLLQQAKAITNKNTERLILFLNFASLLNGVFSKNGFFTDFLLQLHSKVPSSCERPWQLVAYADEVHPGNQLAGSARKTWCFYVSFLEFKKYLSKSDLWFCLSTLRSSEVSSLQAGYSQVFRLLLENIFSDDAPRLGVLLKSSKGTMRLHFSLGMILQDGSAHKTVFANRQDTGSKPCFLCKNIFQLRDADTTEGETVKVFARFLRYSDLQVATDEEVLASWNRLKHQADSSSAQEFKLLQQAAGLSFNQHAFLSSTSLSNAGLLKPVSLYCFDYMHALCSHGVLNDLAFLVLEGIHAEGIKVWEQILQWMQLWVLPKGNQTCKLGKLFEHKEVLAYKKSKALKCTASEMLSLYKPLSFFLQTMFVANNVKAEQCVCFLKWANVLDYLVSIPHLLYPSPAKLLQLVEAALQSTVVAGWSEDMKPKQHWTLHFADCLRQWNQLPACWSLERKHKQPRKYGSVHCNLQTYDKGVLAAVTMEHIHSLVLDSSLFQGHCHAVEPAKPKPKLENILKKEGFFAAGLQIATTAILQGGSTCKNDDVVFLEPTATTSHNFSWRCGKLKYFLVWTNVQLCIVDVFEFLGTKCESQASRWQAAAGKLQLVPLEQVLQPVIHNQSADGVFTCLTPAPLSCAK